MDNMLKLIGRDTLTVSEAMQQITDNASRILFLVDDASRLKGCITDGDIRRYLLAGGSMSGPAMDAANKTPRIAGTMEEARRLYHQKNYIVIPVVSERGVILDLYSGEPEERPVKKRAALNVPVVINAGGKGTRISSVASDIPKPMIRIEGKPVFLK